jgi:hypothetical protein
MKRLSVSGVLGIVGSAFLLTGACGGSSFTAADGSGGLAGNGVGKSGADGTGDSQSAAGESGSADASGAGGLMSGAGAGGRNGAAGAGGSMSTAGAGGSHHSGGAGGSAGVVGVGGTVGVSGAGGMVSSGGSSGGAGMSGSAGSGGNSCVTGTVTFKMVPAASSGTSAFCAQGCTGNWLTITDSNQKTVVLDRGCGVADCKTCASTACLPIACTTVTIPPEGLNRTWDETQWNPSVCGAASAACSVDQCVPAGKYKAKMCAVKNTSPMASYCSPGDTPVCTTVDFVLPGAMTVQGTIGG